MTPPSSKSFTTIDLVFPPSGIRYILNHCHTTRKPTFKCPSRSSLMKVHITPQSSDAASLDGGARSRVGLQEHYWDEDGDDHVEPTQRCCSECPQDLQRRHQVRPDLKSLTRDHDHHHHHHCLHRLKPPQQGPRRRGPWALQRDLGNRSRRSLRSPHHSHS